MRKTHREVILAGECPHIDFCRVWGDHDEDDDDWAVEGGAFQLVTALLRDGISTSFLGIALVSESTVVIGSTTRSRSSRCCFLRVDLGLRRVVSSFETADHPRAICRIDKSVSDPLSPPTGMAAVAMNNGDVELWRGVDLGKGKRVVSLTSSDGSPVNGVCSLPWEGSGAIVAGGQKYDSGHYVVEVWNIEKATRTRKFAVEHANWVMGVDAAPATKTFYACSLAGRLVCYDPRLDKPVCSARIGSLEEFEEEEGEFEEVEEIVDVSEGESASEEEEGEFSP